MATARKKWLAGATIASIGLAQLLLVSNPVPARAAVSDWQQGATMSPRWTTDFGSDSFLQSLTDLKNTGANSVAFVVPYYQSNPQASDLGPGWNTPTDASLRAAIQQAHGLGLAVNIKMHAESSDGTWRAHIRPNDRAAWYAAYNGLLVNLARIAQEEHAELITIGTEMVATAASSEHPENTQRWQEMIANVRAIYSGKLTYGANSNDNNTSPFTNEKRYINFWGALDYAGISAYYQLNSDNSVEGLKGAWDWWNNNDLRGFQQSVGKPLLFAEIGYRSIDGAHWAPWDWGRGGAVNQDEQANAYEALMSYWNDYPYMTGIYWWDWSTDPNAGGGGSGDYTPQNKKAESTMTKWFTNAPAPGTPGGSGGTPAFSSNGSSNPSGTTVGSTVTLSASLRSLAGTPQDVLVDIEVYDESNTKVFQYFVEGQDFGTDETRNYQVAWSPSAPGTYRMTTGVFNGNWSTAYHWNNNAASITVTGSTGNPPVPPPASTTPPTNPPPPPPSSGNLNIWWPTDGAHVSGVQPLKAMVEGMDVSQYKMFWQVDNGTRVEMFDSAQDYPHKEAWVDYSGWRWNAHGPYTLTFTAEQSGSVIASKSVGIIIDY